MKSAASVDNLTAAAFQFNTLRSSTLKRPQTSDGKSARERLLSSKSQSNLVEPHEVKRIQHEIQQLVTSNQIISSFLFYFPEED